MPGWSNTVTGCWIGVAVDWRTGWPNRLLVYLVYQQAGGLVSLAIGWWSGWSSSRLVNWMVKQWACWSSSSLVDWLVKWYTGRLIGVEVG